MNDTNRQFEHLLGAAAAAPKADPGSPSFALETRVMAGWRSGEPEDATIALIPWFRWAAACAFLLMLLSLLWNFGDSRGAAADETSLADSAMRMALNHD
jgi:hypothetical protein